MGKKSFTMESAQVKNLKFDFDTLLYLHRKIESTGNDNCPAKKI